MKTVARERLQSQSLAPATEWVPTTLGALGRYWNGRGFKRSEWRKTGRQIIRIQDLTGTGARPNYYQGDADERHVIRSGDLLVSWAATLGVFVWDGPEAVLNQHIFKVESQINRRFHRYVIESVLDRLRAESHGTGMVHITRGRFLRTPVLLPQADDQETIAIRIASRLSELAATDAALRQTLPKLRAFRAAVLRDACEGRLRRVDAAPAPRELPHGWIRTTIADLLREPLRNGHSARASSSGTGIRTLRLSAVTTGDFSEQNTKLTRADAHGVRDLWLEPGDLLIERSNTAELVGTARVYRGPHQYAIFPDLMIRARFKEEVDPGFIELVFQWGRTREYLRARAVGVAGNMPKIDQDTVASVPVPLPLRDEQAATVREVQRRLRDATEVERTVRIALQRLPELRRAILAQELGGVNQAS